MAVDPKKHKKNSWALIKEFMRSPGQTGAIAASSPFLAAEIVRQALVERAQTIVEFGPGTGSFTHEILQHKKEKAFYIGIEINSRMVKVLQKQLPQAYIVADSAENTPAILKRHNLTCADCIVSGLPWMSFSSTLQNKLITAAVEALRPGGRFVTFTYINSLLFPASRRFRKKLKESFSDFEIGRVVWKNLPAAVVYRCIK